MTQPQKVSSPSHHLKKNKLLIPLIIITTLLLIILFIFTQTASPSKTTDAIGSAVKDKDFKALSRLLTSDGQPLTTDQSKAFIKLLDDKGTTDSFIEQLNKQAKSVPSTIKLADRPLIDISKNGKKFGIISNYQFSVSGQNVQLEAQDDSTLTYSSNGKEKEVDLTNGQTIDLGTIPAGLYTLPATKNLHGTSYKGELLIDTTQSPEAKENFKIGYIRVILNGDESLDDGETIIKVNDQQIEYDENKDKYGPFNLINEMFLLKAKLTVKTLKHPQTY